jgi:cytochrome P450
MSESEFTGEQVRALVRVCRRHVDLVDAWPPQRDRQLGQMLVDAIANDIAKVVGDAACDNFIAAVYTKEPAL